MIDEFVMQFMMHKDQLKAQWDIQPPRGYDNIVTDVIKVLNPDRGYGAPDYKRITEINDGDYQGTLVFVIGSIGYQPSRYWYFRISYGSCPGCDAFENCESTEDYVTLALHIIQSLKEME